MPEDAPLAAAPRETPHPIGFDGGPNADLLRLAHEAERTLLARPRLSIRTRLVISLLLCFGLSCVFALAIMSILVSAHRSLGTLANADRLSYEIRNAVALLRLGWKERALGVLEWLIADQRPPGWRQWPEVSTRDPRAPRFLGDLPHGWVASSLLRAVRRLVAYERDDEGVYFVWIA